MTASINRHKLDSTAAEVLKKLLATVPFIDEVTLSHDTQGYGFDIHAVVRIGNKNHNLIIQASSVGQPLKTRNAIAIWQAWARQKDLKDCYFVFAAPYMSEASRNLCREAGIGFFDLTGNCYLCFGHVFIERFGFKHDAEKRELRSIFELKASRILRRLLSNPSRHWTVQELAKESQVSNGLVSQVKTKLLQSEVAWAQRDTFALRDPERLLKQWSDAYRFKKHKLVQFYSPKSLDETDPLIVNYCKKKDIEYALTLNSAVRLTGVQHVRLITRSDAFVTCDPLEIGQALGFKPVESGGNIVLINPVDEDLFFNKRIVESASVVSDIQLYLDFAAQSGRVKETAEFLLDARILRTWKEQLDATESK